MRIAIISDIHANSVPLETVLADIEHARADQIVASAMSQRVVRNRAR